MILFYRITFSCHLWLTNNWTIKNFPSCKPTEGPGLADDHTGAIPVSVQLQGAGLAGEHLPPMSTAQAMQHRQAHTLSLLSLHFSWQEAPPTGSSSGRSPRYWTKERLWDTRPTFSQRNTGTDSGLAGALIWVWTWTCPWSQRVILGPALPVPTWVPGGRKPGGWLSGKSLWAHDGLRLQMEDR